MEPSGGNSLGLGRHSSNRTSATASDFSDDEYDLNHMAVSDGFRPSDTRSNFSHPAAASSQTSTIPFSNPAASASTHDSVNEITPKQMTDMARRPSSISKAHRPHDSLTLHNGGAGAAPSPHFSRPPLAGAANGSAIVRAESPYQGPSGPSHPYSMYPQRTLSNATASTDAATPGSSRFYGRETSGPTHPYSLYPQHTTPVHESSSQQHIPLGFTPAAGGYQRQLGPDGEDAGGLIGPLGHTEELPPYSRYPTEAYSSKDLTEQTVASTPASEEAIQGAGGIGMATRNPEFSSTDEDLGRSRSPPSIRSTPSQASRHEINTAAAEIAEKPRLTKWQRRARKKMCGIVPYWAICLLFTFIIITGSIMAGVLTSFLNKEDKKLDDAYEDSGPPAPVEPDKLTTLPPDLVTLATGNFVLPPLDTNPKENPLCLNDFNQRRAWSCNIPLRAFSMEVSKIPNASEVNNYELTLQPIDSLNSKYIWGTLPPNVPDPAQLVLVNDTSGTGRGPAWWLRVKYNKQVVVSESDFSPDSASTKRSWTYEDYPEDGFDPSQFKEKSRTAVDGDRPWICTWPQTTLEIFIFPNQNSSLAVASTTSSAGVPAPTQDPYSTPAAPGSPASKMNKFYPRFIKFNERRSTSEDDPKPSCRQVQIFDYGHQDKPVIENGKPKTVEIMEIDPSGTSSSSERRWESNAIMARTKSDVSECGCLWVSA